MIAGMLDQGIILQKVSFYLYVAIVYRLGSESRWLCVDRIGVVGLSFCPPVQFLGRSRW